MSIAVSWCRARRADYAAATAVISTLSSGAARCASTVVRAGAQPAGIQASQTEFIAAESWISFR